MDNFLKLLGIGAIAYIAYKWWSEQPSTKISSIVKGVSSQPTKDYGTYLPLCSMFTEPDTGKQIKVC